ncbi:interferon-induced very large GTPase 1-like isoform X1 [Mya arenaria]|uniref:interferon-induced very large GTPase 1-like isoform X1 n=1 Tax=Mya arenaria TaxID=6604 RepID=UPI0022E1CC61|nr:interferon-induced very large GTPase 1-like isoform X1 [Mya arenaria]
MGVDLQTYRGRIGSFNSAGIHNASVKGSSVLGDIFLMSLMTGSLSFIGLLLFMAGIEINPGPLTGKWPDSIISQRDIVAIAACIGEGLLTLGLVLGFSKAQIEQIQMDNRRSIEQAGSLLYKWLEKERNKASFTKLFTLLQDVPGLTVNWEKLEETYSLVGHQPFFNEELKSLLLQLDLTNKFPEKISVVEALAVDIDDQQERSNEDNLKKAPWILLKSLLSAVYYSRDTVPNQLSKLGDTGTLVVDLEHFYDAAPQTTEEGGSISRLDILWTLFHCCDPFVKQIIVRKLYICNLAVPFLSKDYRSPLVKAFIWPLRHLSLSFDESSTFSEHAFDISTHVIAFGRLGRPTLSKSCILNEILSDEKSKTKFPVFYDSSCESQHETRSVSQGTVDLFWLHPRPENYMDIMTTLFNMRGNLAEDFNASFLNLTKNLADILVVFTDIDDLKRNIKSYEHILKRFRFVVVIMSGLVFRDPDTLRVLQYINQIAKESSFDIKFIQTNKGEDVSKTGEIVKNILKVLAEHLKGKGGDSLHTRFDKQNCQDLLVETIYKAQSDNAERVADSVLQEIIKEINAWRNDRNISINDDLNHCRHSITPCSSIYTSELSKLIRALEVSQSSEESEKIQDQILGIRKKQTQNITESVASFVQNLCECRTKVERHFFINWLKLGMEKKMRKRMPCLQLMKENEEKVLKQLRLNNATEHEIKQQELTITDIEKQIENLTFGVDFLFRETAHICDSFIYLTEDTEQINLPSLEKITNTYADLVIQGQVHLELIDSDNFYMPTLWIRNVLALIDTKLINSKLITVSVLGLQSSGKSTLLNTMLCVHFSVSSGRCSRGIYAQLLPVRRHGRTEISPFNYLMVVDSEGLRSSDLLTVLYSYNRDNEMATFVTGLGNISIMNIMGEHISDLKDILQIVVNALLRLYEANNALPKDQRCFLVHHNVSEHAAKKKMSAGIKRFVECLDGVTEEAAIQEGSLSRRFTDVIQFDHDSSVQYIPCLWQGVYHLKHVNTEYSSAVIKLKHCLMNSTLNIGSGKTFTDFGIQAVDLWKGVISENFVFSFRNRLEIKAYCTIMEQINRSLWREEMSVRKKVLTCSHRSLSQCKLETNVKDKRNKLRFKISNAIEQFTESAFTMCEDLFGESEYKDITIKWKCDIHLYIKKRSDEIHSSLVKELNNSCEIKNFELSTLKLMEDKRTLLKSEATKLAKSLRKKGKEIDRKTIDSSFNKIWKRYKKLTFKI